MFIRSRDTSSPLLSCPTDTLSIPRPGLPGGRDERERDTVVALGGLAVLGTNRHESLRIDRQLRGRAGRQGDPGSSRFFISLEDPLIERFDVRSLVGARHLPEMQPDPVESPVLRREIDRAQRIIEGENFDARQRLWKYAALGETERQRIQSWRRQVLEGEPELTLLQSRCVARHREARSLLGARELRAVEQRLTLLMIDRHWSDPVAFLRWLRDAVFSFTLAPNLHPYEPGRNPLTEFYQRAGEAFNELPDRVEVDVVAAFERITITAEGVDWEGEGLAGPSSTWTCLVDDRPTGAGTVRALASSPATNVWGGVILAPLVLLLRLAQRWRRRRAA